MAANEQGGTTYGKQIPQTFSLFPPHQQCSGLGGIPPPAASVAAGQPGPETRVRLLGYRGKSQLSSSGAVHLLGGAAPRPAAAPGLDVGCLRQRIGHFDDGGLRPADAAITTIL